MADSERPKMNGADDRLKALEERAERLALLFQAAETQLNPAQIRGGLETLREVHRELRAMIEELRGARTLALPSNWRIQMEFDTAAQVEFLRLADEGILALAVGECDAATLAKWRRVLGIVVADG